MAKVRTCLYSLLLLVLVQRTLATPLFGGSLLCSVFCMDDYGESSKSSGIEDYLTSWLFGDDDDDDDDSSDSDSEKPAASPSQPASNGEPQKINLSIPPANGVNVTVANSGTSWWLNLVPWATGGDATTAAPTTAAPATTPANGTAASTTAAA